MKLVIFTLTSCIMLGIASNGNKMVKIVIIDYYKEK